LNFFLTSTVKNAAVAAGVSLFRTTNGWPVGTRANVFADQTCPSIPGSGCRGGDNIFLGTNLKGVANANFKTVVIHELGHRAQSGLYGVPLGNLPVDGTDPSCTCAHVTSSNKLHCLQSRHDISTPQAEGWGQFFAATTLNIGTQNNCTFAYYKEFRNDNTTVTLPPMAKNCFTQVRWMEGHCNAAGKGTEFDWMNFYWRLLNKDGLFFIDFQTIYLQACGGSCENRAVPWGSLATAVNTRFGVSSPKAIAWNTQGNNFGVDH
jgi:hypothetical protein